MELIINILYSFYFFDLLLYKYIYEILKNIFIIRAVYYTFFTENWDSLELSKITLEQ